MKDQFLLLVKKGLSGVDWREINSSDRRVKRNEEVIGILPWYLKRHFAYWVLLYEEIKKEFRGKRVRSTQDIIILSMDPYSGFTLLDRFLLIEKTINSFYEKLRKYFDLDSATRVRLCSGWQVAIVSK